MSFRAVKSQTPVDETVWTVMKRPKQLQDNVCLQEGVYITLGRSVG